MSDQLFLLYTFSVPAILCSQSIQPSIYYFLATTIQLWVFTGILRRFSDGITHRRVVQQVYILTYVTVFTFSLNYLIVFYARSIGAEGAIPRKVYRLCAESVLAAAVIILAASYVRVVPFGCIRHTLTFAPFLYLFAGNGLDCTDQFVLSRRLP